jgi:G:T/U-mismatch repair DNA glycosylase
MRVLIVGQNPGNNPKAFHYKNHTIDRLNKWCDFLGIYNYTFMNCVQERGEAKIKDVDFDFLKKNAEGFDKIICLGSFASICLNRINKSHFKLPHPSPRNRLMNDKKYVNQILSECREYINE